MQIYVPKVESKHDSKIQTLFIRSSKKIFEFGNTDDRNERKLLKPSKQLQEASRRK